MGKIEAAAPAIRNLRAGAGIRSKISISTPGRASREATMRPAGPAPMTATFEMRDCITCFCRRMTPKSTGGRFRLPLFMDRRAKVCHVASVRWPAGEGA